MTKKKAAAPKDVAPLDLNTVIEVPTSFESPESSTIAHALYDERTQTLRVFFKRETVNDCYEYSGIPSALWVSFYQAASKGNFFAGKIRPLYSARKLP